MKYLFLRVRPFARVLIAMNGFHYHFWRFFKFGGWRADYNNRIERGYAVSKIYHALEKSMSFQNRKTGSGWTNAFLLMEILQAAQESGEIGDQDAVGLAVLRRFLELDENKSSEKGRYIRKKIKGMSFEHNGEHGVKNHTDRDFFEGCLESPEAFFLSRYSLREFDSEVVDEKVVMRAVALAMKSPSVCNRQAWHVYHTTNREVKRQALECQLGNRGFGDQIPNLLVITTDLKAFTPGQEHYQHWIDGGLFSMSLILALHSLGIASCCLNWSQSPAYDKKLRSLVNINSSHTIVMLLAMGKPSKKNNVCVSSRRPVDEIYSSLTLRAKS